MILEHFNEFRTTATVTRDVTAKVNDIITKTTESVGMFSVLYWEGSAANAFVDEKFKDRTSAVIAAPVDSGIKKADRVSVGGKSYRALDPDNVGYAGEYLLIALEVF